MKKISLVTIGLFCFFSNSMFAQNLNWQWAKGSTGGTNIEITSVASDNDGNAIVGGYIMLGDSALFGPYTINPYPIVATQFLVKYSPSGQVLWVFRFPFPDNYAITNVATDLNNNIYTAGLGTTSTLYLMKVSSSGNLMWLDSAVTPNPYLSGNVADITTDNAGNVYFAGYFGDTEIIFGHDTLHGPASIASPNNHYFLAKYTASGTEVWAKTASPEMVTGYIPNTAEGIAITTDKNDHLLVGGNFSGDSITFGNVLTHGPALGGYGGGNIFVTKYDTAGNALWARTISSIAPYLTDLCADQEGNVYAYGTFYDSLFVGDSLVINRPNGSFNIFVVKFDPAGNLLWCLASNSVAVATGQVNTYSITSDKNDHIFISGGQFDTFSWTTNSISCSYNYTGGLNDNCFILILNTAGHIICGEIFAGGGDDVSDLAVDPSGYVYFAGDYAHPTFVIGTDTLNSGSGGENAFLAKFIPCGEQINSIENVSANARLQIYPNPLSSTATVQYDLMQDASNATLTISDIPGRVTNTYPITQPQGQLNINAGNLSRGVYFYSLTANGKTIVTKKMVVE